MNKKNYVRAFDKIKASDGFKENTAKFIIEQFQFQSTTYEKTNYHFNFIKVAATFGLIFVIFIGIMKLDILHRNIPQNSQEALKKIVLSPDEECGMGDSREMAYDVKELIGENPVIGKEKEISKLPVYKIIPMDETQMKDYAEKIANKLGDKMSSYKYYKKAIAKGWSALGGAFLEANCENISVIVYANGSYSVFFDKSIPYPKNFKVDGSKKSWETLSMYYYERLSNLLKFEIPDVENLCDYSFSGEKRYWSVVYDKGKDDKIEEDLQRYSLNRVRLSISDEGGLCGITVNTMPNGKGVMYPIISKEQAIDEFKKGNFVTNASDDINPEKAKIMHVELEYWSKTYQEYVQPVYKIIISQDEWDKEFANGIDVKKGLKVHGTVYVPAVSPEYVKIESLQAQFN